jgi:hypothetical protein
MNEAAEREAREGLSNRARRVSGSLGRWIRLGGLASLLASGRALSAQEPNVANYDESKVPQFTLPDPLKFEGGKPVTSARQWRHERRGEVLELFRERVYGRSPGRPQGMSFEVRSVEPRAFEGAATRKEVRVWFTGKKDGPWMDILLYVPNGAKRPVPAFLGLNFEGNHAVTWETGVTITPRWVSNDPKKGRVDNRATEAARGRESSRWALRQAVARGYAVATIYYGDIEPDHAEGWKNGGGVRSIFPVDGRREAVAASSPIQELAPNAWGAIGAWAWGLSRALDYLETDRAIDARRVAVLGHSRLGKTSLWAGAQDERFAIVISNNSGEGGAALSRRQFGERTRRINTSFPHWFCANFKEYNDREDAMPVDQHELLALAAPRPLYVASAEKDLWADPRGEFLAAQAAEPVYTLLGKPGLGVESMPDLDRPVGATIGYHIRRGVHDVTDYDWARYLDFADRHFGPSH